MNSTTSNSRGLMTLRRLAQARVGLEFCELCSVQIPSGHRHLLETGKRTILCTCQPCALRFENVVGGRFQLIPQKVRCLANFSISDQQWESLAIPIGLAFFFHSTAHGRMTVLYPSPAGAAESLISLERWEDVATESEELKSMHKDVEALLVNRTKTPHAYYVVPIDLCFELVGLIRAHWRGLSGGERAWTEIERFFERLRTGAEN